MPSPAMPKHAMPTVNPVTIVELLGAIKRSRASSAPSPLDQIPYQVFKKCPSLVPALLDLFNTVLSEGSIPSNWKMAVFKLIGKNAALEDPHSPDNFRPIALTPAISKLLSGILKDRWLSHMLDNGYLDPAVQKAFLPTIPGVAEHHSKLAAIINGARQSKRSLAIAWLDITNAYGSVNHALIQFALDRYHAPPEFCKLLQSWYTGLTASISTPDWVSPVIPLEIGVLQGDPLSVVIFLTVMATLSDTLDTRKELRATIPSTSSSVNHLLYADDTCITASSPAACQELLNVVEQWLDWAGMKAKPSKSRTLCLKASTGRVYTPHLSIGGEYIQPVGDTPFKFLGMHIRIPPDPAAARSSLKSSLESMLQAIDAVPVIRSQRLRLYKQGVCPCLMWPFLVERFPISLFKKVIQPLVTRYLKKWSGLMRSANTSLLFLSPRKGGLGLPSVTTMYKKQQVSRQVQLQTSRDPRVRKVAQQQLEVQRSMERVLFKPAEVAHSVIELDSNLCRKNLNRRARALVTTEEDEALSANLLNLPQQGRMMTQFGGNAAALWSRCISKLPPEPLSFILNATVESLPTNANLFKWGKWPSPSCALCHGERQSLLHVLNACSTAMSLRRYSARHDAGPVSLCPQSPSSFLLHVHGLS